MRVGLGILMLVVLIACGEANQPPPANPNTSTVPATAPSRPAPKARLEPADINAGMRILKPRFQVCYDTHRVQGMAKILLTIEPAGQVSNAQVTGAFAGTPTGDRVALVAGSARFPAFVGTPLRLTYPLFFK